MVEQLIFNSFNIKNANVLSDGHSVYNNNGTSTNTGVFNVCNTNINSVNGKDIYNKEAIVNYYNVTFSNGGTTSNSSNTYGAVTNTSEACNWTVPTN